MRYYWLHSFIAFIASERQSFLQPVLLWNILDYLSYSLVPSSDGCGNDLLHRDPASLLNM